MFPYSVIFVTTDQEQHGKRMKILTAKEAKYGFRKLALVARSAMNAAVKSEPRADDSQEYARHRLPFSEAAQYGLKKRLAQGTATGTLFANPLVGRIVRTTG
jgi:hypothetical protein